MANRALLKKIKSVKDLRAYQPSSEGFKELIFEQIRLDVPILEIGSSSIGKSYSIRDFMDKCGVEAEFLFVGTEKSEFIEGIPNLKAAANDLSGKFQYLKPNWFPSKDIIRTRLKSGRAQLNGLATSGYKELADLWQQSQTNYDALQTLKKQLTKIRRSEEVMQKAKIKGTKVSKYVYSDALAYISMAQGFGNFWLILDEIDKVEKQDKDKYAPLLHIVRERELKGWKLSGLRDFPEFDVKYALTIDDRITRLNKAIDNEEVDLTDTRIIGIANDLQVMEEEAPALYRRFVKCVIDRSLYDENQFNAESSSINETQRQKDLEADPGLAYQVKRNEFHGCIAVKPVPGKEKTVQQLMAEIDPEKVGRPLDELNLQWTLGFLPDLLFPGTDTSKQAAGRELFVPNMFIRDWNETEDPFKTYIYKIITDNFTTAYWIPLLECVDNLISYQKNADNSKGTLEEKANQLFKDGGLLPANFNNPPREGVDGVLLRYNQLLLGIEDQLKSIGAKAQKELQEKNYKAEGDMSGITGSILLVAQQNIQLGGILIEMSFIGKKKTVLTDKLMSAIPFIQNRLISSSPYISHTYAKDMMNYMNDTAIKMVTKTEDDKITTEKMEAQAKLLFEKVEIDKDYLLMYGCGVNPADIDTIKNLKLGGDVEAKDEILQSIFDRRPVIIYDPLVTKLNETQKIRYYENLAAFKMIEKEIFSNLPNIMQMIAQSFDKANSVSVSTGEKTLNDKFREDIEYYCFRFPHNMSVLADAPAIQNRLELYNFIKASCENAITGGTDLEIDRINSFS